VPRALSTLDPALFFCPGTSRLAAKSVHVWSFVLATSPACREQCAVTLSAAEQARAARFVDARNRNDFIVAHGALRQLLARYTGLPARTLAFALGANGKPTLNSPAGDRAPLSFNMTHSHGRALIAVSDGREVGIDLEQVNLQVKALAIARRYFAAAEYAAIQTAAPFLQPRTFFHYWVAKEAVLKGEGIGLKFPIDGFEIEFDAEHRTGQIRIPQDSRLAEDWRVHMLHVTGDWIAALAVRGDDWELCPQSLAAQPAVHT